MVLPIHDSNPTHRFPVVTYALIVVNVVAFLLSPVALGAVGGGGSVAQVCRQQAFFDDYAAVPKELTSNTASPAEVTGEVGQDAEGRVGCVVEERPDRDKNPALSVLTAMFLHGGWLHLAGNMLFLYVFGNNIEDRLGRLRYLGFYGLCGYAATYGFALADPSSTSSLIGASGAVAGVLGAYFVLYPRARVVSLVPFLFFLPLRLPAWLVLGGWFLLQYLYSSGAAVTEAGGVAYLAHVLGFVVGAALVWRLRGSTVQPLTPKERRKHRRELRRAARGTRW